MLKKIESNIVARKPITLKDNATKLHTEKRTRMPSQFKFELDGTAASTLFYDLSINKAIGGHLDDIEAACTAAEALTDTDALTVAAAEQIDLIRASLKDIIIIFDSASIDMSALVTAYKVPTREPSSHYFMIGDALGTIAAKLSYDFNDATAKGGMTLEQFKARLTKGGVHVSGIRVESENGTSIFSNAAYFATVDVDGYINVQPLTLERAIDGDKYDNKVQEYIVDFDLSDLDGLILEVDNDDTVNVTLYIDLDYNRR